MAGAKPLKIEIGLRVFVIETEVEQKAKRVLIVRIRALSVNAMVEKKILPNPYPCAIMSLVMSLQVQEVSFGTKL
ncbi:hypothetical protein B7486_29530 [cyanobacterium TDX16]|nr:hypothetical protein B7486_29530 [cyanobacterium TDX16]